MDEQQENDRQEEGAQQPLTTKDETSSEQPQVPGQEAPFKGRPRFARFKPLTVGEEIDVKIESKGSKGDGIAKVKGLVVLVPGGEAGQDVRIKVVRILRNFAVGEIIA